ncbi:MAG: tetraacyldisaccharide 4'-kinase [Pseudomonadota bacterium]
MQPPAFWFAPRNHFTLASRMLAPLSWIWASATRRRIEGEAPVKLSVPVICVGNLTLGGAGKTPTVIALLQELSARGHNVHAISRGHGGSLQGPVRVDPERHSADKVGDEPLLLAMFAPVWVGRDRVAAGRAAVADGADVIVMDDGFQNPALHKDISLVVVDAGVGFGNGRVAPAGPLREPVVSGLARGDLLLVIGGADDQARFHADWPEAQALPAISASLRPLEMGMAWHGLRAFAFAGIARPEKFFASLKAEGAELVATRAFDDHAQFDQRILARIQSEANALGARLVTTEKDAVRLPPSFRRDVLAFPVRLKLHSWQPLNAMLDRYGLGNA